jgi:hypothetical protein
MLPASPVSVSCPVDVGAARAENRRPVSALRLAVRHEMFPRAWLFTLAVAVPIASAPLPAQVVQSWIATYGSTVRGGDQASALAVDPSGNVYVSGRSLGVYATVKYDRDGRELWVARRPASEPADFGPSVVAVDCDGNSYVAAFDEGITFLYDASGNALWTHLPLGVFEHATAVLVDGAGDVYVAGIPLAVIKYDPAGNVLWTWRYPYRASPPRNTAAALAADDAGYVYLLEAGGGGRTVKLDADGYAAWSRRYDAGTETPLSFFIPRAIAADRAGGAYVAGLERAGGVGRFLTLRNSSAGELLWLNFGFLGGFPPAAPFPSCGPAALFPGDAELGCRRIPENCR